MNSEFSAIILASGNATRLQEKNQPRKIKSLQKVGVKEVLFHILEKILQTNPKNIFITINKYYTKEHLDRIHNFVLYKFKKNFPGLYFVFQKKIIGTAAGAKLVFDKYFHLLNEKILVFHGDTPFVSKLSIQKSIATLDEHFGSINRIICPNKKTKNAKILLDQSGFVSKLIEFKEYKNNENIKQIKNHGGGIFACRKQYLKFLLENCKKHPILKEFSIFSLVNESFEYYGKHFFSIETQEIEFCGVDDRKLLKKANKIWNEMQKLSMNKSHLPNEKLIT
jgi:bifunctional N-acetylglucosamine-1-phosphate-uridyltransferase/glucosamine-1-phosphate-acetyltransferase GlmU-like protein